ncbi:CCE_0567 family metalloprotein [Pontiella agarivorans]|uniref:CCE_0567 family metalloprotein n=1 Tax=Pontiella agarivorans TaxID=3038953 RepID=A0ABU5MYY5_9BACT|nr:CCE_0567 family metalloprotein [Pontiella agarivorans]MDZ8119369.1 CCE_0567 family metalloprotein [Pontiella agarivorans]
MSTEEIKDLEKQVTRLKFIAGQKAGDLHDLIEDRLWAEFEDIPAVSEAAYNACKAWQTKQNELNSALSER